MHMAQTVFEMEKWSQKLEKTFYPPHSPQCVIILFLLSHLQKAGLYYYWTMIIFTHWWINSTLFKCNTRAKQLRAFTSTFTFFPVLSKMVVYFVSPTEPLLRIRWITAEPNLIKLLLFFKASLVKEGAFHKDNLWCPKVWDFPSSKICLTE